MTNANDMQEFWNPRFVGRRFEDHAMPLEVLRDLAALESLVVDTAKWLYVKSNPGRKRAPKGFTEAVSIKIAGIGDGSSVPKLVLSFAVDATLFGPPATDYYLKAKERIIAAVDAAENGTSVQAYLAEHLLGYFDRIGRGLLQDETIELGPGTSNPARLSQKTRRAILLESTSMQEYADEVRLRGVVSELDQGKRTFMLTMRDGRRLSSPYEQQHLDDLLAATTGYAKGRRVSVDGVAKKGRNGTLIKMETVEHVTLLDPLDIDDRLDELRAMESGWLDGEGQPIDPDAAKELGRMFAISYDDDLDPPRLYPTVEGNVRAEWSSPDWEVSLDIDLLAFTASYNALRLVDEVETNEGLVRS